MRINADKYADVITQFKQINLDDYNFADSNVWDAIAKAIEGCDETALSYFKTLDDGNGTINNQSASVEGLGVHLKATGQSFNFAAIKATLLNTALNAGIFLVASVAIQGIAKALDNYIHRLDNAKEALSSTQSELSSVNDELKDTTDKLAELEALDPSSLSITDKEDLQRLKDQNEELRIRQKYLEDQEKYDLQKAANLTKEKYGQKYGNVNRDKVDEYRSLYNNKETKTTQASSYLTGGTSSQSTPYAASKQSTDAMRGSGTLADLIAQYEYYLKLKKEAVQNNDTEGIKQYEDKLTEIANKLRDDRTELQGFSDDLKAAGDTSDELDNIIWQLKAIDDLLLSPGQNLVNFLDKDILVEDKQKLVDLANAGKLTQDELSTNFSEVDKYLKENGLILDDLISVVKTYKEEMTDAFANETGISPISISQTIEQLNTQLKPAFDSLKSAYQDIFTDDGFTLENVDTSMLSSIKSAIDELNNMEDVDINIDYSSFENLAKVLTDTSSTADDVHEAMNSFATDIVNSLNPAISECDGESYKLLQTLLESMGIVNAEEVLMSQLGYSYEEYANAKEAAANSSINLNNSIDEVATALQNEGLMATEDAQQIMNYMLAKMSASGATIDVSSTIGQLAEEYDWLAELINQWGLYYSVSQKGHGNTKGSKNLGAGNYTPVQTEEKVKVKIDAKFDGSKLNSAAKSAGKSAGKSLKDGLKEELSDLDNVISGITGRIDDQISSINEQKSAALDSIDAQKEALEEAKDAAVEALEAERDARLEVIETQKAQLEEQIKLIDKQIKQKQDEIKAIEDASAAKDRENKLMLAQYNLQKMINQRTKLVKIKCLTL